MMKLFQLKSWPVCVTMILVPALIISVNSAIYLAAIYFRIEFSEESLQLSRCIFEYNCSRADLGLYALMGGMVFALSWTVAYSIHFDFPKNASLLVLGTLIAAPLYAFGIGYVGEPLQTDEASGEELSILSMSLMGGFGAAFHIFFVAIAIRLTKAFIRFHFKKVAENKN